MNDVIPSSKFGKINRKGNLRFTFICRDKANFLRLSTHVKIIPLAIISAKKDFM